VLPDPEAIMKRPRNKEREAVSILLEEIRRRQRRSRQSAMRNGLDMPIWMSGLALLVSLGAVAALVEVSLR